MDSQMKKGILELCLLCFIKSRDRYGYELVETASKYIEINENTVYPILRRMTEKGLLSTYLQESSSGGPARKYYKLSKAGSQELERLISEWLALSTNIKEIIALSIAETNEARELLT